MQLKRNTTSNFFVDITQKKIKIDLEYFDAKNICNISITVWEIRY